MHTPIRHPRTCLTVAEINKTQKNSQKPTHLGWNVD